LVVIINHSTTPAVLHARLDAPRGLVRIWRGPARDTLHETPVLTVPVPAHDAIILELK
jgi:hypothetical protein